MIEVTKIVDLISNWLEAQAKGDLPSLIDMQLELELLGGDHCCKPKKPQTEDNA